MSQPWSIQDAHLGEAEKHVAVGQSPPTLRNRSALIRLFGRAAAKLIQSAGRVITVRQSQYNHSLLSAVRDLGDHLREAERRAEQLAERVKHLEAVSEPLHTRPGTLDAAIWHEVRFKNEYRLPERFGAGDVILDIGAHVGSFSFCCLQRGAGRAYCFEPEPDNFALTRLNLTRFGKRAVPSSSAVWRNDGIGGDLFWTPSHDPVNTGGGTLHENAGVRVPWEPFDWVVDRILADGADRIRLLKIDCESAEFPILLTSRRLDRIAAIHGEYHEVPPDKTPAHWRIPGVPVNDRHALKRHLENAGFSVELVPQQKDLGLFFATRG